MGHGHGGCSGCAVKELIMANPPPDTARRLTWSLRLVIAVLLMQPVILAASCASSLLDLDDGFPDSILAQQLASFAR
jgi:hypothetical protein